MTTTNTNPDDFGSDLPSDSEMLDWLQGQNDLSRYTGRCLFRMSTTGRGWRLHETSGDNAYMCVRNAIAVAMQEEKQPRPDAPETLKYPPAASSGRGGMSAFWESQGNAPEVAAEKARLRVDWEKLPEPRPDFDAWFLRVMQTGEPGDLAMQIAEGKAKG
jgi:hypothetical protein